MLPEKRPDSSLWPRIAVGVLFAPLVLWLFWNGGYPLFAFLALLTLFGQMELFSMLRGLPLPHRMAGHLSGLGILLDSFVFGSGHLAGILVSTLIALFVFEIAAGREDRLKRVEFTLLGSLYPALFITYFFRILQHPDFFSGLDNRLLVLFVVLTVWIFDTASYFSGRVWGKHPFFPLVSPKKTVEGFLGGVAGILVFGTAVGLTTGAFLPHLLAVTVLAGLAGQAGDLAESVIKRDTGIKDSSHLIPGHGGVLDRFDSLLFAVPTIYGYLIFFG
jgi:phosphatidate cytidylyltransferase